MQNLRSPIVVILGHVDHGKTTLLDAIRQTDLAAKEYGGITQSIGAFQTNGITFIDTPGHEIFSQMRSKGAKVADIAVLVVAADNSVMPQTRESIKIIQEANIPFIVAINKIDLPEANVDKVIQDLLRHEVLLENYGGQVPFVKISAKKNEGVKELLDLIKLMGEINNITGDPEGALDYFILESQMDKTRGWVVNLIVRNGTLKVGQNDVRALFDCHGKNILAAGPGTPVSVLGWKEQKINKNKIIKENSLNLILKTDTAGSLEAIKNKLPENINLLEASPGEITEKDILLAKSTKAIILGFNVKVVPRALKLAQIEKILVRTYKIIYELLDELQDAAAGMLEPVETEEILGTGQIIAEFPFEKQRIAGIKVTEGRIARGDRVKLKTQNSKIKSLRIGKEESTKAEAGKECGILLDPQVDFNIGDDIIAYRLV